MKVRFVPATLAQVSLIAGQMRPEDIREVRAQCGMDAPQAMRAALEESPRFARTALLDLQPLAMFGLAGLTVLGESAQVWCFGTRAIDDHPLAFAKASRLAVDQLLRLAGILTNVVDADDVKVKRWLTWLGATYVLQPEWRNGRMFYQFILAREKGTKCRQA